MNFIVWLLKRILHQLIGSDPHRFVEAYRDFIRDEFFGALIITFLLGVAQFILGGLFCAWAWNGKPPMFMLYVLLANPVVFFVYNWLVVLYGIYENERLATWERLKD